MGGGKKRRKSSTGNAGLSTGNTINSTAAITVSNSTENTTNPTAAIDISLPDLSNAQDSSSAIITELDTSESNPIVKKITPTASPKGTWVERVTKSKQATNTINNLIWSPIKSLIEAHNILHKLLGPKRLYWEITYQLSIAIMLISARYYAENQFNTIKIALDKYVGSNNQNTNLDDSFSQELSLFYAGLVVGCLNSGLDFLARKFEMRNKSLAMKEWQKQHYSNEDTLVKLPNGTSYIKKVRPYYDMSNDPNANIIMKDAPINVGKMVRTSSEILIKTFAAIATGAASISFLTFHSNFQKPLSAQNIIGCKLLFTCAIGILTALVNKKYTRISNDTIPLRQIVQTDEHEFNKQSHAIAALKAEKAVEAILNKHQEPVVKKEVEIVSGHMYENLFVRIGENIDPALNYLLVRLNSRNPNVTSLPALLFALVNSSATLYLKNKLTGQLTELNQATTGLKKYYQALKTSTQDNPDLHIFSSPDQTSTVKLTKGFTLTVIGKENKREILRLKNDVSLERGQIILISGESGRGKTRLMNTLARLYQPQIEAKGTITFATNYNLNSTKYLPQANLSLPNTTFLQMLAFPMIPEAMSDESKQALIEYADTILQNRLGRRGFAPFFESLKEDGGLDKQCDPNLSGGEQKALQLFWIIRDGAIKNGYLTINTQEADLNACPLVLLDEVFNGMDNNLIYEAQNCLKQAWTRGNKLMATFLSICHSGASKDFYTNTLTLENSDLELTGFNSKSIHRQYSSDSLLHSEGPFTGFNDGAFSPVHRQTRPYTPASASSASASVGFSMTPTPDLPNTSPNSGNFTNRLFTQSGNKERETR